MFEPICIAFEQVLIHSFRPEELSRYNVLAEEVFKLLSDEHTLRFIPEKRLR